MTQLGKKQIPWTEEELQFIRDNYQNKNCKEMAIILNRTLKSVRHKYNLLGLVRNNLEIGAEIDGWKIIDKYAKQVGKQTKTIVIIQSINNTDKVRHVTMTALANHNITHADHKDLRGGRTTHNLSKHPLYLRFKAILSRCTNPNVIGYHNYGGRGIEVCKEWVDDFQKFYDWCIENKWSEEKQIDRINNDGNYSPDNCRIVTRQENANNRRVSINITAWGETKNASDWSLDERCKTSYAAMLYRIEAGWTPEDAISIPSKSGKDKFNRHKQLYKFIKENHPDIIQEFLS